jgi:DNA mismatch endonuclease (patch repair protein)
MGVALADVFSKEKRSWVMSRIRSKDTKVELSLAKALKAAGIRYRRHPRLLGTPDFIVFNKKRKALVFVDGDFWHGWGFEKKKRRLSAYWRRKIETNMSRDKTQTRILRKEGWKVIRVWEHDMETNLENCIRRIRKIIKSG